MSIKDAETKLFNQLKINNPSIVTDGIVNEKEYLDSKYKILYVMKEVNSYQNGGWSLTEFISNGAIPQTWDNVARWTEGILNLEKDFDWEYLSGDNDPRRDKYLKKIASINLKKTPGRHTSVYNEIRLATKNNKEFIKKQVDIYQPNIIICCGTSGLFVRDCLESDLTWQMTSRGIEYMILDNTIIVSFSHPEARVPVSILRINRRY
ncbi:hypothetical protein ACCQ41_07810 [Anaerococcus sp. ENR0831]|uniref:Uracil-DNA glycosylase-like domain-containing protein n=1 Tax=Anaerococcus martiniensis TaxID=3115615 RepID=A0ABW9MA05_9FIRM